MNAKRLRQVFPAPRRTQFNFRCTPEDRAGLFRAARMVGKSVTSYLLGLHQYATGKEERP